MHRAPCVSDITLHFDSGGEDFVFKLDRLAIR